MDSENIDATQEFACFPFRNFVRLVAFIFHPLHTGRGGSPVFNLENEIFRFNPHGFGNAALSTN